VSLGRHEAQVAMPEALLVDVRERRKRTNRHAPHTRGPVRRTYVSATSACKLMDKHPCHHPLPLPCLSLPSPSPSLALSSFVRDDEPRKKRLCTALGLQPQLRLQPQPQLFLAQGGCGVCSVHRPIHAVRLALSVPSCCPCATDSASLLRLPVQLTTGLRIPRLVRQRPAQNTWTSGLVPRMARCQAPEVSMCSCGTSTLSELSEVAGLNAPER
jgi:hypothetical protein